MSAEHLLHTYQCSLCGTTATSTLRYSLVGGLLNCVVCRRFMGYVFSQPISEEEHARHVVHGVMWNQRERSAVNTKRPCDECKRWVEMDTMIRLGVGGKYCSVECADTGTEKHRVAMEAQRIRLEALYDEMPWLRPEIKETA